MPISYRQAIKALKEAGFERLRHGDHEIWKHPFGPRVSLGNHGSNQELKKNENRELEAGIAEARRLAKEVERQVTPPAGT